MLQSFRKEKGVSIAITMVSLVVIMILAIALLIRSTTLSKIVQGKNYTITALEAAKAGISYSIYSLDRNIMWGLPDPNNPENVFLTHPVGNTCLSDYAGVTNPGEKGYYKVDIMNNIEGTQIEYIEELPVPVGSIGIISTGNAGNPPFKSARVIVIIPFKSQGFNPYRFATYGSDGVTANGSAMFTDSYNSNNGPYNVDTNKGHNGHVGSDHSVNTGGREVDGNVYVTSPGNFSGSATGNINTVPPVGILTIPTIPAGLPVRSF